MNQYKWDTINAGPYNAGFLYRGNVVLQTSVVKIHHHIPTEKILYSNIWQNKQFYTTRDGFKAVAIV